MAGEYYDIKRRQEVREEARKLRRKFLRYKEAELVYSMQHKKLMELADRAGAIYPIQEIQTDLGISRRKAIDCLGELERIGLVEKKQRGQGRPSILYVKNFIPEAE